jgi:hypothetical protein
LGFTFVGSTSTLTMRASPPCSWSFSNFVIVQPRIGSVMMLFSPVSSNETMMSKKCLLSGFFGSSCARTPQRWSKSDLGIVNEQVGLLRPLVCAIGSSPLPYICERPSRSTEYEIFVKLLGSDWPAILIVIDDQS